MRLDDARLIQLKRALALQPASVCARQPNLREAAVALLVRPREQLELLLIKRAVQERDPWSGHMALPGGRREPGDADLVETAIRETEEEVGITLRRDDALIAALDELGPSTKRLPPLIVAPFVFAVPPTATTRINEAEVDIAIWVPVSALRDEKAASEILIELEGGSRAFPSFKYGEYVIWGMTHRILTGFLSANQAD